MNKRVFILLILIFSANLQAMSLDEELIQAIEHNDLPAAKKAVKLGADVNSIANKYNVPPLFLACSKHTPYIDMITFLLNNNALVNGTGPNKATALHWASTDAVAQILITRKANTNAQDIQGNTPLHKAIQRFSLSRVELLLEHGAKPLIKNGTPRSVKHQSAFKLVRNEYNLEDTDSGRKETLRIMYQKLRNYMHGNDWLIKAIQDRNILELQSLLDHGFSCTSNNNSYNLFPIIEATRAKEKQSLTLINILLAHGASPNVCDSKGNTPLHTARTKEIAALLIHVGANVNATNAACQTPLDTHSDTSGNNAELRQLLIDNGALSGNTTS